MKRNTRTDGKRRTADGTGWRAIGAALAACTLASACHRAATTIQQGRVYPSQVARAPTLDIQVVRHTTKIELTNTTATALGPSTLWLNGRYSRQIGGLAVGEHRVFNLTEFTDEFGEPFRAGGFFATENPDMLALAEIETPREDGQGTVMLPLIVVGQQEQ